MSTVRRTTTVADCDGFTLIELLLVISIIGILASIAIPGLTSAKQAANEASAIGSTRTLNEGQVTYSAACGAGFYSDDIALLVNESYLSPDLALPLKSGFTYALTPGINAVFATDCGGNPTTSEYYWSAAPATPTGGRRAFASTQVGTIWQDATGVAPVEPLGTGAETPLQ